MRKLNVGCGSNILPGWENHDADMDITKPLPFEYETFDMVLAEHVVEHITTPDAVRFFMEAHRILKIGGTLRIAVPSADAIFRRADKDYLAWHGKSGFGDGTLRSAVSAILLQHGHLSAWNKPILEACLFAAGFDQIYPSRISTLEGHGKVIGESNNKIETIVMVAHKS